MRFGALLGSEVRRLAARRAVRWCLGVALLIVIALVVVNAVRSTGTGFGDHTMYLRQIWLEGRDGVRETALLSIGVYLMIVGVAIAATAIGADYRAGTVGTLLTWEPRRVRVVTARLLAIGVVTVGTYVIVIGVFVGGWTLGAAVRGSTAGLGPDFWTNIGGIAGRSMVAVLVLAGITAGLALLTRGAVGALIIWFGYLVGIEGILAGRVPRLRSWLLIENLGPFLEGRTLRTHFQGAGSTVELVVHPGPGLVRVLVITAIVVLAGILAFARRDVA